MIGLVSVSLGLASGIKKLSQINMVLAISLLLFIFILGPTIFIINALIQNFGAYLNSHLDEIGGFEHILTGEDYFACSKLFLDSLINSPMQLTTT